MPVPPTDQVAAQDLTESRYTQNRRRPTYICGGLDAVGSEHCRPARPETTNSGSIDPKAIKVSPLGRFLLFCL
jgi:hypothetical protein